MIGSARRVAAENPAWRFVEVPGAGHVPMLEDPAFTLDVLGDWLAGLPLGAESGSRTVDASRRGTEPPPG
jgi:hypothetical protein